MDIEYTIDGRIYNLKPGYELYLVHDINYFEKPENVPEDFGMLIKQIQEIEYFQVPTKTIRLTQEMPDVFFINFMNHELSRRYKDWTHINDDWFINRLKRLQYNFFAIQNK